jgi:antitoxin YefM
MNWHWLSSCKNKPSRFSFPAFGNSQKVVINKPKILQNLDGLYFVHKFIQVKIQNMLIASVSEFRKDIKSYLDRVAKNFETLIINRGKDSGIVVMSLEEYNSLMATNYELSSRKNELRLDSAIEKLKDGKSFTKDLSED